MRDADSFEFGIFVLFLFNNEHILLLEEDLNYDPLSSPRQFKIVDNAKISDIVHLVGETLLFDSFLFFAFVFGFHLVSFLRKYSVKTLKNWWATTKSWRSI